MVNELTGGDPARWRTNIPTYDAITYAQLYAGIDLRYDGTDGKLKSTYSVAPGADPARIRWRYLGPQRARVDAATGNLLVELPERGQGRPGRSLVEQAPIAWPDINGQRVPVVMRFEVAANGSVGFVVGSYDTTRPLTIDPNPELRHLPGRQRRGPGPGVGAR